MTAGRLAVALAVGLGLAVAPGAAAHEIPAEVTVRIFVRPAGDRLQLLVRVPLEAMRDLELPLRGPYLDLPAVTPLLADAASLWIADSLTLFEAGRRLPAPEPAAVRLSLPSDRSFAAYDTALAHLMGPPLEASIELVPEQALLDVLLEAPIASANARFAIEPALARLGQRTITVLRFLPAGGAERAFQYVGDPGLVRLDPRWHQAVWSFVRLGFQHILEGWDHLLFLLCLVLPIRRVRPLVAIVTSFTVAHSLTLIAAALGLAPAALWFPVLIETLIALSIVYMALENILGAPTRHRWAIAFAFGLVHGFGFAFALGETLQFAGGHLLTALLSFNLGVEAGQLAFVALAVPLLGLAFHRLVAERAGVVVASVIVAHSAWHWMSERASQLRRYRFEVPALDALVVADLMRWSALALACAAAAWALSGLAARLRERGGW